MTKVMRLNVTYYGSYGGDVNEILLLPTDINGVFFEELEEKSYDRVVSLGEIEGKHSECYGDLDVDFVDLDSLSIKQITNLIGESNFGEFESFFERSEEDFEEDEEEYSKEKVVEILKTYGIQYEEYTNRTDSVYYKFIEQLKEKYVQKFKSITVLEENFDKAVELLKDNGIEAFE